LRIRERLEKSWVVEGPITALSHSHQHDDLEDVGDVGLRALMWGLRTDFIVLSAHELRCRSLPLVVALCRLLGDIVGGAELNIRFFEIVLDPVQAYISTVLLCG